MRLLSALVLLTALPALSGGEPPPTAGGASPKATAWACTKKTLLDDVACTVEGRTAAEAPSKDQAKENQRQAKVLADSLCDALARGEDAEPNAGVLQVCTSRVPAAIKRCGGDGQRRLLDDAGRFNPGHARCYGALAGLVRDVAALADDAGACCDCVADSCRGSADQCTLRIAEGRAPDVANACLEGVCSSPCAQVRMMNKARKP